MCFFWILTGLILGWACDQPYMNTHAICRRMTQWTFTLNYMVEVIWTFFHTWILSINSILQTHDEAQKSCMISPRSHGWPPQGLEFKLKSFCSHSCAQRTEFQMALEVKYWPKHNIQACAYQHTCSRKLHVTPGKHGWFQAKSKGNQCCCKLKEDKFRPGKPAWWSWRRQAMVLRKHSGVRYRAVLTQDVWTEGSRSPA